MNRDVILQVADRIEALPSHEFKMSHGDICIGAYVPYDPRAIYGASRIKFAFDIPEYDAVLMYASIGFAGKQGRVWPNQREAVAMLRNYAETQVVDWEGTKI